MYYFRALNNKDMINCLKKAPISAVAPVAATDKMSMVSKISQHIKDGSKSRFAGCWISACKDFSICASEFAIPQSGKFNTATKRKCIAVITAMHSYHNNLTYCAGQGNGKNLTLDTSTFFQDWNSKWGELASINEFIFDLSFPYTHKRTVNFYEYSYGDWVKEGFIKTTAGNNNKAVPGIPSGDVRAAREILVLNNIHNTSIVKVLELLEIDILYALIKLNINDYNSCLHSICGQLFQLPKNNFSGVCSYLYQELYINQKNLHELTYEIFKVNAKCLTSGYDILSIYVFLKDKKREIISSILNQIGYSISASSVILIDDEIEIAVYSKNSLTYSSKNISIILSANNVVLPRLPIDDNLTICKNKYDILFAVDYNGNIINDLNQSKGKYFGTILNPYNSAIIPIKY